MLTTVANIVMHVGHGTHERKIERDLRPSNVFPSSAAETKNDGPELFTYTGVYQATAWPCPDSAALPTLYQILMEFPSALRVKWTHNRARVSAAGGSGRHLPNKAPSALLFSAATAASTARTARGWRNGGQWRAMSVG